MVTVPDKVQLPCFFVCVIVCVYVCVCVCVCCVCVCVCVCVFVVHKAIAHDERWRDNVDVKGRHTVLFSRGSCASVRSPVRVCLCGSYP